MNRCFFFLMIFALLFPSAAGAQSKYHIIQKGDTISRLSREYGVPVSVLQAVNRVADPESLAVGSKLLIPEVHVVKKGDTLYSLSRRYGVTVDALTAWNRLPGSHALKINQKLYILTNATEAVTASASSPTPRPSPTTELKSSLFWPHPGPRQNYEGKMRGIIISGEKGDLAYSVSKGRVIWAGPYRGFGNVILVNSADGLVYGYMGIEELIVSVGEEIESGSALGRLGVYFHQTDAKLLFIVYNNAKRLYLDPQEVLNSSNKSKG